ncbi:MAG: hypothetical protein RLY66_233 [Candidatus Parcubacteria bacterium]|jgi:hypothetical protein
MNLSDVTNSLQSAKTTALIRILIILFVLLVIFWIGITLGWHKADFSYRFSDNYYHSSGGDAGTPNPSSLVSSHGAVGKVLSINLPTMIVSDANGIEKSVHISNDTIIRSGRGGIASTTITDNDFIIVIGNPGVNGQITAKLIRVLPPAPILATTSVLIP